MSLDNIQLPPTLVRDLYKKALVDLDEGESISESLNNNQRPYLGRNEKRILVIVDEKNAAYLPDDHLEVLMKMLTACHLTMADIALINFAQHPELDFASLNAQFDPRYMILFGCKPSQLGFPLEFPSFQLQRYNGQVYLASPSMEEMSKDVDLKRNLWQSLKTLFEIS